MNLTRTAVSTAITATAALVVSPLLTASPAAAADREFRYGGAEVEYDVEKDNGRFEVDVDIDGRRGDRWRVQLWHDGNRYHSRVHSGDVEIDKRRADTRGDDVFKVRIKKVGGPAAVTRTITRR